MRNTFIDDWMRGTKDCREGRPHKTDQGQHYDSGYSAEYHRQQAEAWQSEQINQAMRMAR